MKNTKTMIPIMKGIVTVTSISQQTQRLTNLHLIVMTLLRYQHDHLQSQSDHATNQQAHDRITHTEMNISATEE